MYLYKPWLTFGTMIIQLKLKLNSFGARTLSDDVKHAPLSKLFSAFLNARKDHITKGSRSTTAASNIRSESLMQRSKTGLPPTWEIKNNEHTWIKEANNPLAHENLNSVWPSLVILLQIHIFKQLMGYNSPFLLVGTVKKLKPWWPRVRFQSKVREYSQSTKSTYVL